MVFLFKSIIIGLLSFFNKPSIFALYRLNVVCICVVREAIKDVDRTGFEVNGDEDPGWSVWGAIDCCDMSEGGCENGLIASCCAVHGPMGSRRCGMSRDETYACPVILN